MNGKVMKHLKIVIIGVGLAVSAPRIVSQTNAWADSPAKPPDSNSPVSSLVGSARATAMDGDLQGMLVMQGLDLKGLSNTNSPTFRQAVISKAANGDLRAMVAMGAILENPRFGPTNVAEALEWYRKAADRGLAKAQVKLGEHYGEGRGVPMEFQEAAKWFRKAAEQGDAEGQCYLGSCYDWSHIAAKDCKAKAVEWYRKAAEQGFAEAQYDLGACYGSGDGVSLSSVTEAAKWYRKAAEQGHTEAQYRLGACYTSGDGVPRDYEEAVKWYRKAAEQEDEKAQWALAGYYREGRSGVPKDDVEAYKWLNLAGSRGWLIPQGELDALEKTMSPEQVARAQQLSRTFKPIRQFAPRPSYLFGPL